MDTVSRIFELLDAVNMEQKKFAALIGVSPSKISEWKLGKAKSYTKYIPQIAEVLGTTTEYLLTGNGPKKKTIPVSVSDSDTINEDDIKAAFFNGADPTLTPEERDAMWEDAQEYFRFKIAQRRQKQQNGT